MLLPEPTPDVAQRWASTYSRLVISLRLGGSIHFERDGFVFTHRDSELPRVQLHEYDNFEKSALISASWQALNAADIEEARAELLPIAKRYKVRALVEPTDSGARFRWWGKTEAALPLMFVFLDAFEFQPDGFVDKHVEMPKSRVRRNPKDAAREADFRERRWNERIAERKFRVRAADAHAGLIASQNVVLRAAQLQETARLESVKRIEELRHKALSRPNPAPEPQLYGVSHEGAEELCKDWLRHLGVLDAAVTRYSTDGGIDITSERYVAQVKNYAGSVGVDALRSLHGVAVVEGKSPILMTSGSLTRDAEAFTEKAGIIAIHYDAKKGKLNGLNKLGESAVEEGLS